MKVRANLFSERLIRDYLSRVSEAAARYLPKDRRNAFVGYITNLIARECGPAGEAGTAVVREVLARLGPPEDLVLAERARLDAERARRHPQGHGAGDPAAANVTAPLQYRPPGSRWRPAAQDGRSRRPSPDGQGDPGRGGPSGRPGAGDRKRKGRLGGLLVDWPPGKRSRPGGQAARASAPRPPAGQAGQPPGGTARPAPGGAAGQAPGGAAGQAPGGAGAPAPAGAGAQAPGGAAAHVPGGAGAQASGGAGETILEG